MKKFIITGCVAIGMLLTSCNKNTDSSTTANQTAQLEAVQAVSVSTTNTASREPGDSIYAVNTCDRQQRKTVIAFSTLSSAITSYLTTNYAGFTQIKAVQITDNSNTVVGYVAIISFNGKPVAIKFDANGNFVKVLEQRQGRDIFDGRRFHHGGCFDDRDGLGRDSIAIANLPAAITTYIATTFSTDTIVKAFITRDSNIVVITKSSAGVYANIFNSSNVLIKRVLLQHCGCHGKAIAIAETDLLSSITAYLATTYPGYTFKHAFKFADNAGAVQRFVVLIDVSNSKYAVEFDANGSFIEAHIVH